MANDNDYDDRGRGSDDRERDRDRDDDRRPDRDGHNADLDLSAAKRKVSAPAIALIIAGLIGLLMAGWAVFTALTNPYAGYENAVKIIEAITPAGAQRDDAVAKMAEKKEEMRSDTPATFVQLGLDILLNLLAVVGGFSMKSLGSRGLALTGAIAAIIPISGCCLLTTPFGIWAVVVLSNVIVKRGFALNKRGATGDSPADDRWGDGRR